MPINAPQGRQQPTPGSQPTPAPAQSGRPQPSPPVGQPTSPPASSQQQVRYPAQQDSRPATGQQVPPRGVPPRAVTPRTTGSGRLPAAQQRQPIDLATRLDGQRGWLAQLDKSLKRRTIVALVLTCLAVGVGAAALYISLTKNSDSDRIDALQTRVEALETAAGIPSTDTGSTDTGTVPETGVTLPDTGVTLPDGTTDSSGVVIPPTGGE